MCVQMFRALGTVVHLAMSADGSCRGLRSSRDGPVVLELTQGMPHLTHAKILSSIANAQSLLECCMAVYQISKFAVRANTGRNAPNILI